MTNNQLKAAEIRETKRSNREKERETKRSNLAKEAREGAIESAKVGISAFKTGADIGKLLSVANDPSWYNLDKQLVKDVANLSFNNPLGNEVEQLTSTTAGSAIPGITTITFTPTIGVTDSKNGNAADSAALSIYSYVRHANSGSKNYDRANMMMYLFAMDQAISTWCLMRKLYSLGLTMKGHNRYYNKAMIESLGFDADDIRNNLATFRSYINAYAIKLNSLFIPKGIAFIDRHSWLNSNIFKDQPIKKSPIYHFRQRSFGYYDSEYNTIRFGLLDNKAVEESSQLYSLDALYSCGEIIISALLSDEDIGIMSGDILKAYGEGKLIYLPSTSEEFHIEEVYSEEVLSQITNMELVGDIHGANTSTHSFSNVANFLRQGSAKLPTDTTDHRDAFISEHIMSTEYDIWENDKGEIVQGVPFRSNAINTDANSYLVRIPVNMGLLTINELTADEYSAYEDDELVAYNYGTIQDITTNHIIKFYKDDISCDEAMVASRGFVNIKYNTQNVPVVSYNTPEDHYKYGDSKFNYISSCGTEVFNFAYVYKLDAVSPTIGTIKLVAKCAFLTPSTEESDESYTTKWVNSMKSIAKFEWFPQVYTAWNIRSTTGINYGIAVLDVNDTFTQIGNYSIINQTVVSNMHYVAVLSEYGIPSLGLNVRLR